MGGDDTRWVDKIPDSFQRSKDMEVLCLGLSRTGTMSLYTALNKLGYQSYHYVETPNNRQHFHLRCWLEALNAKVFGKGKPYGRPELDKMLGNYNAVTDAPCVNLSEDIIKAYPNAKVVLNTRDVDKWLVSMERSYYDTLEWKPLQILSAIDSKGVGAHIGLLRLIITDWTSNDWRNREKLRAGFLKHYENIRRIVPKENLLEHCPQDGWGPLCKFLGKPEPEEPYPCINQGDIVFQTNRKIFWHVATRLVAKYVGPAVVAACAFWYLQVGKA